MSDVLKVHRKFYDPIKMGLKTQILRRPSKRLDVKKYDYIVCEFPFLEERLMIEITGLGYKAFNELTEADADREGFDSLKDLKIELQHIYPQMDSNDRLYYYQFKLVGMEERVTEE